MFNIHVDRKWGEKYFTTFEIIFTVFAQVKRFQTNLSLLQAGVAYDNYGVSPVVRQTLQHWAYSLTKPDYEKNAKRFK